MKIIGADFETVNGEPRLFTAYDGHERYYSRVNRKTVLPVVLDYLRSRATSRNVCVMYFHHLDHDLVALLYNYTRLFESQNFTMTYEGAEIEVFFYNRKFGYINFPNGIRVRIIDTAAFFMGSLGRLAEQLDLPVKKMELPAGIGERDPMEYLEYALRDAEVTYHLGCFIMGMHKEYDVGVTVSAPHLASNVFRKHFVKDTTLILPPDNWLDAVQVSYRGGKNGLYVKPGFYSNIIYADLVSAYPWAMTVLPSCVEGQGKYKTVKRFVSVHGIYRVSGYAPKKKYPVFFEEGGFKPLYGDIRGYMLTGPELAVALYHKDFQLKQCEGIIWEERLMKKNFSHPLRAYAVDFFRKKAAVEKGDPRYMLFKLMLNSLYGKFIQRIPIKEAVLDSTTGKVTEASYKAGGLYNPFIGSLITGNVRAQMLGLEHVHRAMHTATDSIIMRRKTLPTNGTEKGLGSLQEQYRGNVLLLRNKLYVIFDSTTGDVLNYALHGFHGKIDELLAMWKEGRTQYTSKRMNLIKESLKRGLVPLRFEDREMSLEVDWEGIGHD